MVSTPIQDLVAGKLRQIETERAVRVLYACEAGSRVWGLASRDSDYDVRFIYLHEPDWYLSIDDRRDVIEIPISADLDISGWELRKALRLLRKCNPPLLEWLQSPVVYLEDAAFIGEFRELADAFFSPERCFKHYLHMAFGNFRGYLQGSEVLPKKYLYVLRAILASSWIERGLGTPPIHIGQLIATQVEDPEVLREISGLLARKKAGTELGPGPRIETLDRFIEAELQRLDRLDFPGQPGPGSQALDAFFRRQCGASFALA